MERGELKGLWLTIPLDVLGRLQLMEWRSSCAISVSVSMFSSSEY